MDDINQWWLGRPDERFWLEVTDREGLGRHLRVPQNGRPEACLGAHVRPGDIVFHFIADEESIVARSVAGGGPRGAGRGLRALLGRSDAAPFAVPLGGLVHLPEPVTLDQIGKIQWHLFPALRALEDEVGDPLYYPFDMGPWGRTAPLKGRLFKLPALFVTAIPPLAAFAGTGHEPVAGWSAMIAAAPGPVVTAPVPVASPALAHAEAELEPAPAPAPDAARRNRPPRHAPPLDPAYWMILDS